MLDTNPLMPYDCCPREEDMKEEKDGILAWIKRHGEMLTILGTVVSAAIWMTNALHSTEKNVDAKLIAMEKRLDDRIVKLEKDMTIVKTILLMKNEYPKELAGRKD